jgi:hypothetical protein
MKHHILGYVAASIALSAFVVGCKKDEPPPPLPTAQPVAAPAAPLQLRPEDAGVKMVADSGVKKKVGHGGGHAGGLAPCCAALQQNSTMQPDPMKTYMMQAAALCNNLAAQGKDKSAFAGMLLGLLRGAGMPSACQ